MIIGGFDITQSPDAFDDMNLIIQGQECCRFSDDPYEINDLAGEKQIGLYWINAARAESTMSGVETLKYNDYMDGYDWTFTGNMGMDVDKNTGEEVAEENVSTISATVYVKNRRYGAQAWAETMEASNTLSHYALPSGPCANQIFRNRMDTVYFASGMTVCSTMEVATTAGQCGEFCLTAYPRSNGHIDKLLSPYYTTAGIGITEGYQCVQLGYAP